MSFFIQSACRIACAGTYTVSSLLPNCMSVSLQLPLFWFLDSNFWNCTSDRLLVMQIRWNNLSCCILPVFCNSWDGTKWPLPFGFLWSREPLSQCHSTLILSLTFHLFFLLPLFRLFIHLGALPIAVEGEALRRQKEMLATDIPSRVPAQSHLKSSFTDICSQNLLWRFSAHSAHVFSRRRLLFSQEIWFLWSCNYFLFVASFVVS
jgi:hypothetical protein